MPLADRSHSTVCVQSAQSQWVLFHPSVQSTQSLPKCPESSEGLMSLVSQEVHRHHLRWPQVKPPEASPAKPPGSLCRWPWGWPPVCYLCHCPRVWPSVSPHPRGPCGRPPECLYLGCWPRGQSQVLFHLHRWTPGLPPELLWSALPHSQHFVDCFFHPRAAVLCSGSLCFCFGLFPWPGEPPGLFSLTLLPLFCFVFLDIVKDILH